MSNGATSAPIFISHSSEDAATAQEILAYLEANGAPCWISSRDIPPAAIYADAITEALRASSACLVVVSQAANRSKAVKRELELASHYDKPFIPIRVDDAEPAAALDYYLRNTQWVDFSDGGVRALDRIVRTARVSPAEPAALSPPRRLSPFLSAGASLLVVVVLAGAGWLWRGRAVERGPLDSAADFLRGSYHWDGVACGAGPVIARQNDALVFTMPGTPTYRHTVLRATPSEGGYALRVETRVLDPESSRGDSYVLGASTGAKTLDVITGGRTDTWERCPEP